MRIVRWGMILLAYIGILPALAMGTHEYLLKNDLKVLVREDHRAPVVEVQVWYKVGSSYETLGTTGVSHLLEHLMFQGTKKHRAGEFARLSAAHGGMQNAATSRDATSYYQELPKADLALALDLEADRMQHLLLDKQRFAQEIKVVREERRLRTDDDPLAVTYERFNASGFVSSSYQYPVVGWMNDLLHLQLADAQRWYEQWYAPNNAVLVVVGDVNPLEVLALAKRYFGALPKHQTPVPVNVEEAAVLGSKEIIVNLPAQVPWLVMGYLVPVVKTAQRAWEPYALEVAAMLLAGDGSARLPSKLMRDTEMAASVDVNYDLYARLNTLFTIYSVPSQGHEVAELRDAVNKQVQWLQQEPVSAQALQRAKVQLIAAQTYAKDTLLYEAQQLGVVESVGLSWRILDSYAARINAVTPEQVQAVARTYLNPDHLTVAMLQPRQSEST